MRMHRCSVRFGTPQMFDSHAEIRGLRVSLPAIVERRTTSSLDLAQRLLLQE